MIVQDLTAEEESIPTIHEIQKWKREADEYLREYAKYKRKFHGFAWYQYRIQELCEILLMPEVQTRWRSPLGN